MTAAFHLGPPQVFPFRAQRKERPCCKASLVQAPPPPAGTTARTTLPPSGGLPSTPRRRTGNQAGNVDQQEPEASLPTGRQPHQ